MESYAYFKREINNFTKLSSFFLEQLDQNKYFLFSNPISPTSMLFSMSQLNHIFVSFLINWYLNKKLYRHGLEGARSQEIRYHHLQVAWLRPEAASFPHWSVSAILSEFRLSSSADDSQVWSLFSELLPGLSKRKMFQSNLCFLLKWQSVHNTPHN